MSSSDKPSEDFQPFDVKTLEILDSEKSGKTEGRPPDFERFKLLYEPSVFEQDETVVFKSLTEGICDETDAYFKPLIENSGDIEQMDASVEDAKVPDPSSASVPKAEGTEESVEEKGYKDGFENGYVEGLNQGQEQGYKEGFKKGQTEGLEEGEVSGRELGRASGFDQGFDEGIKQGQDQAREQALETVNSLEKAIQAIERTLPDLLEKYERRIIHLIQQISEKAVLATVEIDDEIVKPVIIDAVHALVAPEEIELTVSDNDYEFIEMIKDDFFEQVESLKQVTVKSDSTIPKGGCRIQTRTAVVETDPVARLEAVFEAMKKAK